MKLVLLSCLLASCVISYGQKTFVKPSGNMQLSYLGKTMPLKDKMPANPSVRNLDKPKKYISELLNKKVKTFDPVIQKSMKAGDSIECIVNFEGIAAVGIPNPDTEGAVGPDHYFQMVKRSFGIWNKQGEMLYGPADNQTIWSDFPGPWDVLGWTDPIVIYDHLSDRWLASCMVYDVNVEYFEMIAVSTTSDPLGEYYCYALWFETMPDYPKFGLWPDGYYLTINEAEVENYWGTFAGVSILVFNREDLINGNPEPQMLYFHLDSPNQSFTQDIASFLPADLDGPPPPEGTPNYLLCLKDDAFGYPEDMLWLWECSVDWNDTANSYFSEVAVLPVESFDSNYDTMEYIHQPNSSVRLTSLSHFLMYRLQYRNFNDYQTLVCNHTVKADGEDHAAVRWYELRDEGDGWYIRQQSSLAPDEDSRWMGSQAMDKDGNIGLGYSISGDNTYPSISVIGQRFFDEMNTMTLAESEVVSGSASQTQHGRWGDYSSLSLDPTDNLTFWYTQMYYETSGPTSWQTRVASFQLHKNLTFNKDTTSFVTVENCISGLDLVIRNNSRYPVQLSSIQEEGYFSSAHWYVENMNINFPYTMQVQDSIVLKLYVDLPTSNPAENFLLDSVEVKTDYTNHYPMIRVNSDIINSSGKHEASEEKIIHIYPNPFSDETVIDVNLQEEADVKLLVLDQNQKIVRSLIHGNSFNAGLTRIVWDGCNDKGYKVSKGTYFLVFKVIDHEYTEKIIIQ